MGFKPLSPAQWPLKPRTILTPSKAYTKVSGTRNVFRRIQVNSGRSLKKPGKIKPRTLERQAWCTSRHCPSILAPRFSSSETHGFSPSPLVALLCTLHVMAAVSPNLQLPEPFIFNIHYPLAIYICVYVYTVHQLYAYAVYKLCI